MQTAAPEKNYNWIIYVASIAIPGVVALLYFMPKSEQQVAALDFLPALNAIVNGTTALVLVGALMAIKNKNINLHKRLMYVALGLSLVFLLSYVLYHATHASTKYGANDYTRYIYYFILLTHILFSAVIVPLVLITFVRALNRKFDRHKRIARITLPLWLYVAITGVIVYLMISPYYA